MNPGTTLLSLLPPSGLDLSLLIAVLSGVLVLFALTEAFGWAFGGLVVPGYLASVLVVSPAAGITVLAEAGLTLAVVLVLSDALALTGVWSRFFGRERFLLLVVVSILVRQASEVWLWPALLGWGAAHLDLPWIQPQDAHSVGLVLVPLTANALGKGDLGRGGLGKGLRQLFWPTLLTYLVLRELLLQRTNLSLGSMSLTYEDVALDFLQSARAYFVLATGAFFATLLNGWFAWSSGGILIPALLGLAWYEPTRILATMGEAVVLSWMYLGISRLPIIRHWNLEGARKLALLFSLSAALRIGIGWAHDAGIPVDQHALSGLGYIISSLIALKILQLGSAPTVLVPAFGSSLLAFVGGSAAAWAVEQVAPSRDRSEDAAAVEIPSRLLGSPEGVVEYARLRARLDPRRSPSPHLPSATLADWRRFWRTTDASISTGTPLPAAPAGLRLDPGVGLVGGRVYVVLREAEDDLDQSEGWGVTVLRPGAPGPAVVVEAPWHDPASARAALGACVAADCAILYFAGMELPTGRDDAREGLVASLSRPILGSTGAPPPPDSPPRVASLGQLVAEQIAAPPVTWVAAPVDAEYIAEVVVPTLGRWSRGEADVAEVQRRAAPMGWSVVLDPTCGEDPCLLLVPDPERPAPLVAVRAGAASPTLIEVPHPHRELGTLRIGLGAFTTLGARVAVFDPSEPALSIPVPNDPTHALHLGWRRELALAAGEPRTLIVRGLGAGLPGEAHPTEPVVIGAGRPIFAAPPPSLLSLTEGGTLGGVWSPRWAASGSDERNLAGNHIPGLQADLLLGGVTPGVLWFSEAARAAWRGDEREAVADWVGAAGLTLTDGSGAAPINAPALPGAARSGSALSGAARATLLRLDDLARRGAHQHNLNLVRKLAEPSGGRVSAVWDPERQLGFLEVRVAQGAAEGVSRAWLCPGDGRRGSLPWDAQAPAIRAALGWMPADITLGLPAERSHGVPAEISHGGAPADNPAGVSP